MTSCATTSIPTFHLGCIALTVFLCALTFWTFACNFFFTLRMSFFIELVLIILAACTSTFLSTCSSILKTVTIFLETVWFSTLTRESSIFFYLIIKFCYFHLNLFTLNSPRYPRYLSTCQFHSFFMNFHKLLKLL